MNTIYSGLKSLYASCKKEPHIMRMKLRLKDKVVAKILRKAVDQAMKRYPYYTVELCKKNDMYVYMDNHRSIVITNTKEGIELNSADSNYHMISFSYYDDWIVMDIFHSIMDGYGVYSIVGTLLYYYYSFKDDKMLNSDGIKLVGDDLTIDEWQDPIENLENLPTPVRQELPKALNLREKSSIEDCDRTVYNISIDEDEFMRFNKDNRGSPTVMVALLISHIIKKMYPDDEDVIRIVAMVNNRKALEKPKAHQICVGGAFLEYNNAVSVLSLKQQVQEYRKALSEQTTKEAILSGISDLKEFNKTLLNMESDEDRHSFAASSIDITKYMTSAVVSYVGKANFGEPEKNIRDFRSLTTPLGDVLLIEIAAVNGFFSIDFIQPFSTPIFVNAFMNELSDYGVDAKLRDKTRLDLPNIRLPWDAL